MSDTKILSIGIVVLAVLIGAATVVLVNRLCDESKVEKPVEEVIPVEKVDEHSIILDGVETELTEREFEMVSRYVEVLTNLGE